MAFAAFLGLFSQNNHRVVEKACGLSDEGMERVGKQISRSVVGWFGENRVSKDMEEVFAQRFLCYLRTKFEKEPAETLLSGCEIPLTDDGGNPVGPLKEAMAKMGPSTFYGPCGLTAEFDPGIPDEFFFMHAERRSEVVGVRLTSETVKFSYVFRRP